MYAKSVSNVRKSVSNVRKIRIHSTQKPYPKYAKTASNVLKQSTEVSFIKKQSKAS